VDLAVATLDADRRRQSSMSQICLTQGPAPTTTVSQSMLPWSVTTDLTAPELSFTKPVTLTPVMILAPLALPCRRGRASRRCCSRSRPFFVQHRRDALGLPVVEQALHIGHRVLRTLDEDRFVADLPLLLRDRGDLRVHHFRADLHVADRVVAECLRVALQTATLWAIRRRIAGWK